MTPPDPATPSPLEALLKEVEALRLKSRLPDPRQLAEGQTRLAAIVRVLREAMTFYASGDRNAFRCESERLDPAKGTGPCCERVIDAGGIAADALRRADEIAGGGA